MVFDGDPGPLKNEEDIRLAMAEIDGRVRRMMREDAKKTKEIVDLKAENQRLRIRIEKLIDENIMLASQYELPF